MERVMTQLIDEFVKKKDVELHLILYGLRRDIFYKIPGSVIIHKPNFEFNNTYRVCNTIRTMFFIRSKVKSINPDSLLSFGELWNNFVLLALFGLKIPAYVSDRCQPNKSLGFFHDRLRKWLILRQME
jgi:GalNAc-alpha-(1->4)-GalNAc-alpha-(1->3)-diNAcBac-PP-undecaprenol alpha-1,4-N-acetyl-D-galactosaminyltransferase